MTTIRHILIAVILGIIAYCIAASAVEWYIDQLKASGGMVTARDLVGAQFTPFGVAIMVFAGYLKLVLE